MGHASVIGVFGGKRIIFDPVILSKPYSDSWVFFPPQVQDPVVFDVDAVVVSHIHQDHYDLEFLKTLDGRAKIFVIGGRPAFEQDLKKNSIKNLHVIQPETAVEIFDGIWLFGVTHESNGIDASAIVFNEDFCVYHGNDNYLQPDSLRKFQGVGRAIDVACIPYAYIHWYPFLLECEDDQLTSKQAEGTRLVNLYMDDCLNAIRILQPKAMIPFGANLLLDDGNAFSEINLAVKTPIEFCEYSKGVDEYFEGIVRPMLAGDCCWMLDDDLHFLINNNLCSESYRSQADQYLKGRPRKLTKPDWKPIDIDIFIDAINTRIAHICETLNQFIFIEFSYLNVSIKIEIDCTRNAVRRVSEFKLCKPYHLFKLDAISGGIWLNGGRFEEVIGTRRFTLRRVPNIYSKEVLRFLSTAI